MKSAQLQILAPKGMASFLGNDLEYSILEMAVNKLFIKDPVGVKRHARSCK